MNVLPYIFAVLLILGLFSQLQVATFTQHMIVRKGYEKAIETHERSEFNGREYRLFKYKNTSGTNSSRDKKANSKTKADRRINMSLILNESGRNTQQGESLQHRFILKELMKVLYQQQPFYQKMVQDRPEFMDEIIEKLILITKMRGEEVKSIQDIETMDLGDTELKFAFLLMMKGNVQKQTGNDQNTSETQKKAQPEEQPEEIVENDQEETTEAPTEKGKGVKAVPRKASPEDEEEEEDENPHSDEGYLSIKDFLHFKNPENFKIRIYLASKELLEAIVIDPRTVDSFLETREELYRQRKKIGGVDIVSQRLEAAMPKVKPQIKKELLDFSASTTNPKDYRAPKIQDKYILKAQNATKSN